MLVVVTAFFAWILLQTRNHRYPEELPLALAGLSLLSHLQYAWDKRRAATHAFRISEVRLHLLDLLGGWPGGWIARHRFRHKISKPEFRVVFLITVLLNASILLYLATKTAYWENGSYGEYLQFLGQRIERHLRGNF